MPRTKGSKNKPKDTKAADKPKKIVAVLPTDEKVVKPPKGLKKKPEEQIQAPSDEPTGPSYVPVNMNNFIFTEHLLERYANYVLSRMDAGSAMGYAKEAATSNDKATHIVIKKMLKSVGFKSGDVDTLLEEIKTYRQTNKPEQLYYKVKRR